MVVIGQLYVLGRLAAVTSGTRKGPQTLLGFSNEEGSIVTLTDLWDRCETGHQPPEL